MKSAIRFIKIGDSLLNANAIRRIWIDPTEFRVELNPGGTDGFVMMGSGYFSVDNEIITINKEKNPISYKDLEKWVQDTIDSNI